MAIFPRQKISSTEKLKKDPKTGRTWGEACVDYFIDETIHDNNREEILSHYRLTEGILDEKDYNYVLNPFNTTIDRYKRFGTTLRNFDIITPVINLYAGEFSQRFKNTQVLSTNNDDDNRYKEGLNKLITQHYMQESINHLNALGIETGQDSIEMQKLTERINDYSRDFDTNRIIDGQEVLDYIHYDQDLDDKFQDGYIDWLKAGITISYKGVFHNDVDYEIVPPWEFTFPLNTSSNFIEDAAWVTRRQVLKANQILDRWHNKLDDAQIEWIEEQGRQDGFTNSTGYARLSTQWISNEDDYAKYSLLQEVNGIEVYHAQWRTFAKSGTLTFINELGQVDEMDVDDTYKLNKANGDISIKWGWISEVWEGWRIGNDSNNMYVDIQPLPYNRMELNNKSAQKLSYNGRLNKTTTGKVQSIVTAGRPYQIIYNILHYQFEKIINKNKDKIAVIPQGLIPKGVGGWDEEKFMYYAHANSMMIIDETSPTAAIAIQGIKVLDMGLGSYAKESIELMQSVKAEWWEAIGMNRQRYGDSKASDGKAVTEQAIFRSAIISDELNRKFEKFQEKDYAGLLDISKVAYLEGKKGKYINSDGREAFLDMNPDNAIFHLESDYNIHVKNSRKESEKVQTAKEYGFNIGQNGKTSEMLELIDTANFAKTKEIIRKMEDAEKRREEAINQATLESNQAIEERKRESEEAKRDVEIYKADKDYDKVIDAKILDLDAQGKIPDNEDGKSEITRMNDHKISIDNKKIIQEDKNLNTKSKEAHARIKVLKQKQVNN